MRIKLALTVLVLLSCLIQNKFASAQPGFVWAKQLGGEGYDMSTCITVDAAGNVYTAGVFSGTADLDPGVDVYNLSAGADNINMYISKLDASGNFIWAKQFQGKGYSSIVSIAVDTAGNVYTAGLFSDTTDFDPGSGTYIFNPFGETWYEDIFISKLDAMGNFIWAKQLGSETADQLSGMTIDSAGNVFITGGFFLTEDFDPGASVYSLSPTGGDYDCDVFVEKLDAGGNFQWVKQLGGTGYDQSGGIAVDAAANVYTTGGFSGTADFDPGAGTDTLTATGGSEDRDIFICELDPSGNLLWAKSMGGKNTEQGTSIGLCKDGDIYTIGYFIDTADFDPGPGKYILKPHITGNNEMFISKLHPGGIYEWAMSVGGSGNEYGNGIAVDAVDNIYITGGFTGETDFNPRSEIYSLSASGDAYDQDGFICKLDANGFLVWAEKVGGVNYDMSYGIAIDPSGNVYTAGQFGATVDFDPGSGINTLSVFGSDSTVDDAFVLKLHNSNVGIPEQSITTGDQFIVYPDPNNGNFNMMNLSTQEKLTIDVMDITGRIIKPISQLKYDAGQNLINIDASELSDGIYFMKIYNERICTTLKFIVER